ncbi:efflux RND transporter periplasmic adaptor subunit [Paenibacillus aestuarii]|uniref:Efflux RND transporter periplasmic adaptor subunit n=1 Tax=Paenibacillus aestuarii TaxID=516965 RepID=A0ABW0K811_9BACL|nr:efflux RND transporter periplasmic adaptor subunit [Paenibacillus aestuarii]
MKHTRALAIAAMSLLLIAAGCGARQAKDVPVTAGAGDTAAKVVGVQNVQKAKWGTEAELAADVIPFMELDVVVKVSGDVTQVHKSRGDTVSKDETILEIDKKDMNREKEKVDAALQTAMEQVDKAKKDLADNKKEIELSIAKTKLSISDLERDYAKMRNNFDEGIGEKSALTSMETKLEQARMDLELLNDKQKTLETSNPLSPAEYQLKSAQIAQEEWQRSMSYYDVKSPISGVLIYMPAEVGMTLPSGMAIAKVQQQNVVKIKANLTDAYRRMVQDQAELSFVNPETGETFNGKVIYLASTADLQTKTFELQLQASNTAGKLKPGTRVQLQLNAPQASESITVPADAVLRENGQAYVFVVKGDQVEKRQVQTGKTKDSQQEITSGLDGSEKIVTRGQLRLQDGEHVTIEQK